MRSLVTEDDQTNRVLLQSYLSRFGECDIALDGRQAVDTVKAARHKNQGYDLVCMDLGLPEMDGHQAIREIRKQEAEEGAPQTAKIIVTTAHTDADSITTALLGRCNAYLVKPISVVKLRGELKKLGLLP